jgi:ATP-dependent DNA helicase RecQ
MKLALESVIQLDENYKIKTMVDFVSGIQTKEMQDFRFVKRPLFGKGKDKDETFWSSIFRHAMLNNLLLKDIESYGLLRMTKKGHNFIANPEKTEIPMNHNYDEMDAEPDTSNHRSAVLDQTLVKLLKDLRRGLARQKNVPPFVIFQDPSLEDMATQYPISMDDMTKITGVSIGKAKRYGKQFISLIGDYVEENEIERPNDFVVKQVANKSKVKVNIIQSIDRKIPLGDIASANSLSMEDLLDELHMIVTSGTKVNIDYYLEDALDEYAREDIYEYFMEADTDDVEAAFAALKEDDATREEICLVRIKFMSEMAN